jgi:glutathione S-transferase
MLNARAFTLAGIHFAPMLDYFTKVPEAAQELDQYSALSGWWGVARGRASLIATDPLAHQ